MISRRSFLLGIGGVLVAVPAAANIAPVPLRNGWVNVTEPIEHQMSPYDGMINRMMRGMVQTVYDFENGQIVTERKYIFDGERWLSLDSGEGMVTLIETQHETNPGALK